MILAGLDEAALGPSLGPFCACLTRFRFRGRVDGNIDLYRLLSKTISRPKEDRERIAIGDSKILYTAGKDIRGLEEGVIAFLESAELKFPMSLANLLEKLAPEEDLVAMKETPWFSKSDNLVLPWEGMEKGHVELRRSRSEMLRNNLETSRLTILPPGLRVVPASAFNRKIRAGKGKSGALRAIMSPLLVKSLEESVIEEGRIVVDRQGGRRYYGEWLAELASGRALRALEEGTQVSHYEVERRKLSFQVKADSLYMETALASMIAKYVRESAMRLFNSWWAERVPGIRSTAGYPLDARRFLKEIELAEAMPKNRDSLIRRL